MSKDIKVEVEICDSDNICKLAKVEQGYLSETDVAMALVRAVNGACVQLGIEPPGALFAQASADMRHQARVARALGPDFGAMLDRARQSYGRARSISEAAVAADHRQVGKEEFESLLDAAQSLGHLLGELRGIDPAAVAGGDGTTTLTETGSSATAPEVTS